MVQSTGRLFDKIIDTEIKLLTQYLSVVSVSSATTTTVGNHALNNTLKHFLWSMMI